MICEKFCKWGNSMKIDIRDFPEIVDVINAALSDGKTIEVKNESYHKESPNIVVVELHRIIRTKKSR